MCVWSVCCVAVRNCLECRERHGDRGNKASILNNHKTQEILQNTLTSKVGCTGMTLVYCETLYLVLVTPLLVVLL